MEVTKQNIENFSKKLINMKSPPVLWSSIRTDGNCFFHAIDYAYSGKILPKNSNKIIELRQNIVSTMNTNKISGVNYEEFMNGIKNGTKIQWPYSEIDVIIASANYYKKTIIVISTGDYGGVTMIRPKGDKLHDPLFIICQDLIHFVPFHSNHVKISNIMRGRLEKIEKNKKKDGAVQYQNNVNITYFLLNQLIINDSLSLTRKKFKIHTSKSKKLCSHNL